MKWWHRSLTKQRTGALSSSCDNSSVSAVCTGRIECSLETKVQFMYWTPCRVLFKTFTLPVLFVLKCGNYTRLAMSLSLTHWLSPLLHDSKSTRERLRTGDMAGQSGLGKSKERHRRSLLNKKRESSKLATCQTLKIRTVSAVHLSEISNELTCHDTMLHASMCDVETCLSRSVKIKTSVFDKDVRLKVVN